MAISPVDTYSEDRFRCPTCGAAQDWSETCRRCKCDLTLLKRATEACRRSRRHCLLHLRAGRIPEALRQARRGYAMQCDESSARLLAVCYLLAGDFREATRMARISSVRV